MPTVELPVSLEVERVEDRMRGIRVCPQCGGDGMRRNGVRVLRALDCGICDGEGKVVMASAGSTVYGWVPASYLTGKGR